MRPRVTLIWNPAKMGRINIKMVTSFMYGICLWFNSRHCERWMALSVRCALKTQILVLEMLFGKCRMSVLWVVWRISRRERDSIYDAVYEMNVSFYGHWNRGWNWTILIFRVYRWRCEWIVLWYLSLYTKSAIVLITHFSDFDYFHWNVSICAVHFSYRYKYIWI